MSLSPLDQQIVDLYVNEGWSLSAVGRMIGVTRETVARRLRKLGVQIRSKPGPAPGTPLSDEHKRRIAEGLRGHKRSESERKALAQCMRGRFAGEKHHNWKGGVKRRSDGYVYIYRPDHPRATKNGYVMEHILVMEEVLDRYLLPEEQVNHINGIRDDNRPENLMVFRDARDHQMWHQYFRRRDRLAQ